MDRQNDNLHESDTRVKLIDPAPSIDVVNGKGRRCGRGARTTEVISYGYYM